MPVKNSPFRLLLTPFTSAHTKLNISGASDPTTIYLFFFIFSFFKQMFIGTVDGLAEDASQRNARGISDSWLFQSISLWQDRFLCTASCATVTAHFSRQGYLQAGVTGVPKGEMLQQKLTPNSTPQQKAFATNWKDLSSCPLLQASDTHTCIFQLPWFWKYLFY